MVGKLVNSYSKIRWLVTVEIAVVAGVASNWLPGGNDFYRFYAPIAGGCLDCGFTPPYAVYLLWPLSYMPWYLWVTSSCLLVGLACYLLDTDPNPALLCFFGLGQLWLGQVDALPVLGLALVQRKYGPVVQGAGLTLLMLKPQLTFVVLLLVAIQYLRTPGSLLKMSLLPSAMLFLSAWQFGPDWPIVWLQQTGGLPVHVWRLASIAIWPFGWLALLSLPVLVEERGRLAGALIVAVLASQYPGAYSYVAIAALRCPPWALLLSYAWVLAVPKFGSLAMGLLWLWPVLILLDIVSDEVGKCQGSNRLSAIATISQ